MLSKRLFDVHAHDLFYQPDWFVEILLETQLFDDMSQCAAYLMTGKSLSESKPAERTLIYHLFIYANSVSLQLHL